MAREYGRFYVALNRLQGVDKEELKRELVSQFTDGRTKSIREMDDREYYKMCEAVEAMNGEQRVRRIAKENLRKKRSDVLHQLQKMGIDTANWNRVDAYCSDPRIAGKKFRYLKEEDLGALLVKLQIIHRKQRSKDVKPLLN